MQDDESYNDSEKKDMEDDMNEKHLTKKERIVKLIQERLGKVKKKMDKEFVNKNINKDDDDESENEDCLDDLNEIEQDGEDEEDNDGDKEEEEEDGNEDGDGDGNEDD